MPEKSTKLAQSNVITQGRYDFTVVEKRAVYYIIREVRKQFVIKSNGQKTLFDNLVVRLKTENMREGIVNIRDVYKSLAKLRKKSIFIEDDEKVLEMGYINYYEHKKHEPEIEVEVSKKILPYLVELAKEYTEYYLTVALSLKNKYSQRFYEYCCQYRNTGVFEMRIEDLRQKLKIENKYPRYALIKKYIIEPAMKELQDLYDAGQCDVCFSYSERKKGRSVESVTFWVKSKEHESSEEMSLEDQAYFIRTWLKSWLNTDKRPKNMVWIDGVMKEMHLKPEKMKACYKKLHDMQKKKPSSDWPALARYIIEEDFLT